MNLVRLSLIIGLCAVAWYAISIYAQVPSAYHLEPLKQEVTVQCPSPSREGAGMVVIAVGAIVGAVGVAAADLVRRVY